MTSEERIAEMLKIHEVVKNGYAGVERGTGMIVDRREHPDAIPMQANRMLGVPEPRSLPEN